MLQYFTISPFFPPWSCGVDSRHCQLFTYSIITDNTLLCWHPHCVMWTLPSTPTWDVAAFYIFRPQRWFCGIPSVMRAGSRAARKCSRSLCWRAETRGTLKLSHSHFPLVTPRINLPPHPFPESWECSRASTIGSAAAIDVFTSKLVLFISAGELFENTDFWGLHDGLRYSVML